MMSHVWAFVVCFLVLSSSSLSLSPLISLSLSTCSVSCSSTSTMSNPPRIEPMAHPHNEEYCSMAMHNPLTRKEGTQGSVAILRTMKFSGCIWYELKFGKEKGNLEALSQKVNFISEILARPVLRNNTWGNLTTSRLWQQSSVEFGEKHAQCWAREVCGEGPETIWRYMQINEDARVFVHDFDLFVTVRVLDETPAVPSLHLLSSKHGYSFDWNIGETPRLANNGKSVTCTMDNFVLLVVPGLSSILAAVCLQHRDKRINKIITENWDYYQIQSRLEVTSVHAGNRCWQVLISRPRENVNQHTIFSDEMFKEDPTQCILDVNLEDLETYARTFLWKSELRFGRWCFKGGDTKMGA